MALLERADAVGILDPYIGGIRRSFYNAWEKWSSIPIEHRVVFSPRTRANIVHDFTTDEAIRNLSDARLFNSSELRIFVLKEIIALRFKKLDDSMLSRNQPTEQVRSFRGQQQIPGIPSVYNLEAGYVLDNLGQNIRSVHIVCPNGDGVYWDFELRETDVTAKITDMFDTERKEQDVKPAQYRRRKEGQVLTFKKKDGDDNQ